MARPAELTEPAPVTPLRPGRLRAPAGGRPLSGSALFLGVVGVAQALVFSASGLHNGYYDFAVWGVLGAVTLVALAAALVVRPHPPSGPALVVGGGLLALLLLSALSLTWADSVDRGWTEVNRLVFYLATFLLATVVLRPGRSVRTVAGVIGAAIGLCALYTLGRLLTGDESAFLARRLNAPADYINGTACLMLMGIWPLVAFAERDRPPALAGLAVALASIEASLLVLTQARAVVLAIVGSAVLVLCAIPGRVARFWALAAVVGGAGAALPWTLAVYSHHEAAHPDGPSGALIGRGGVAALLGGLAAGLAWAVAREISSRPLPPAIRRLPRTGLICLLVAVPLAGLAIDHHPLATVRTQWQIFAGLRDVAPTSGARFGDVRGYRYDLWRVAIKEFEQDPLRGVGAGSYGLRYFQLRANPQSVRQPHSIELQMLAELGLGGLLALLVGIGGVGWALARSRARDIGLSVAFGGTFVVWLLDTSVDWVYNMPGVTGIALLAAAGLCAVAGATRAGAPLVSKPLLAPGPPPAARGHGRLAWTLAVLAPGPPPAARGHRRLAWTLAVLALVAAGAPSLVRQYLAQKSRDRAAAVLVSDPKAALRGTQEALRLNDSSPETYFTRAAAYARLGDYRDARATLLEAVRVEPLNYVPWALLGDLATRRGLAGQAAEAYGRARRLDPGDAALFTMPSAASG